MLVIPAITNVALALQLTTHEWARSIDVPVAVHLGHNRIAVADATVPSPQESAHESTTDGISMAHLVPRGLPRGGSVSRSLGSETTHYAVSLPREDQARDSTRADNVTFCDGHTESVLDEVQCQVNHVTEMPLGAVACLHPV